MHSYKGAAKNFDDTKTADVYVTALDDQVHQVRVGLRASVLELMEAVAKVTGIPASLQTLTCRGQRLEASKTLTDYMIITGDSVQMFRRYR